MSYIDTSVIVASLDPRRELALGVLEKLRDKRVSEIVLAELASIVSRRINVLHKTLRRIGVRDELAVALKEQGEEIHELVTVDDDFKREEEAIKHGLKIQIKTIGNPL